MTGRQQIGVVQRQLVSGGVVHAAQKPGGVGDDDAFGHKRSTHVRIIKQCRQRPGIDLTGLPAAGAAVQPGRVRIVGSLAAVTRQQHNAGKVFGQAHAAQNKRSHIAARLQLGLRARPGQVLQARPGYHDFVTRQAGLLHRVWRGLAGQRVLKQFASVQQTAGFHKTEATAGGAAKVLQRAAPLQTLPAFFGNHFAQRL